MYWIPKESPHYKELFQTIMIFSLCRMISAISECMSEAVWPWRPAAYVKFCLHCKKICTWFHKWISWSNISHKICNDSITHEIYMHSISHNICMHSMYTYQKMCRVYPIKCAHTFIVACFAVVILIQIGSIQSLHPYPSGLLHWH